MLDSSAQPSVGVYAGSQMHSCLSLIVINIGTIYCISFGSLQSGYEQVKTGYIFSKGFTLILKRFKGSPVASAVQHSDDCLPYLALKPVTRYYAPVSRWQTEDQGRCAQGRTRLGHS